MYIQNRDYCRITILLFFSVLLPIALAAQEQLTFVAERDTVVFSWARDEFIEIRKGEYITIDAGVFYGSSHRFSEGHLVIGWGEARDEYATPARYFRPKNTDDVFGEGIFIDYPTTPWDSDVGAFVFDGADQMWVSASYIDVLVGQNRNMLLEIFPAMARLENILPGLILPWHASSYADVRYGMAMFYNSAIMLGNKNRLAVNNIRKTDFGYIVYGVVSIYDMRLIDPSAFLNESTFWNTYSPGDAVTLLLHVDGDYLDIYADSNDIHVGTFIRVGREFITQYQSLIRTNTADLTNVQWPRRAEGSTGIPPVFVVPDNFRNETLEVTLNEDQESANVQNADQQTKPLWVLFAIIGGVVVAGVVVVVRRKR